MYLGHHHGFRRETGEPQLTFNYYRAFTDFIIRFVFGQGVHFRSPEATEAIIPDLLKRIWEVDNDKEKVLLEIGQLGGVSGDAFTKIAYEEPFLDPAGNYHAGRVRLLPLNPAFCMPEFHPHDKERFLRFKLKYRFWGTSLEGTRQVFTYCVDDRTEALTKEGWKKRWELSTEDEVLAIDPVTKEITWEPVLEVCEFDWDGPLTRWTSTQMDALTTPNHRWMVENWRDRDPRYATPLGHPFRFKVTEEIATDGRGADRLILSGGNTQHWPTTPVHSDEFVELIAWTVNEGYYQHRGHGVVITQSESANPEYVERLRVLAKGFGAKEGFDRNRPEIKRFYFSKEIGKAIRQAAPDKQITPEFLLSLTERQARLFYDTCIDGDGHRRKDTGLETWAQLDEGRIDGFQMLVAMLGMRSDAKTGHGSGVTYTSVYRHERVSANSIKSSQEHYKGTVWCPRVRTKTFLARRNGKTYWTGNTEILTEDVIEEYINDELIDQRPNPLGVIPVVHIPNYTVSGSPWGIPDCFDIISLNRHYNEVAENIADIINYHSAPVTIITGAKIDNLEKGANKVWAGLPKDATVTNLEGGYQGLQSGLQYLEMLKRSMHEMVGVPETALGQVQPISNTSGVALSIQFQPLMNRRAQKIVQYGKGLEKINELALRTLALKEPDQFKWNPATDTEPAPGQLIELDLADPITYQSFAHFPPPLPLDKLVVLNEIQQKMQLGLESREGALRTLGEEFPEAKLEEIREELREDAMQDGSLQLLKAQIQKQIMDLTGMQVTPDGQAIPMEPVMGADGDVIGDGITGPNPQMQVNPMSLELEQEIQTQLVTDAYGSKMAQFRSPDKSDSSES